ncbi:unnamed protein product [Closterium sp. Yama58-4]|nr:unnamed protein product [Closterium sp. Yama58-4]
MSKAPTAPISPSLPNPKSFRPTHHASDTDRYDRPTLHVPEIPENVPRKQPPGHPPARIADAEVAAADSDENGGVFSALDYESQLFSHLLPQLFSQPFPLLLHAPDDVSSLQSTGQPSRSTDRPCNAIAGNPTEGNLTDEYAESMAAGYSEDGYHFHSIPSRETLELSFQNGDECGSLFEFDAGNHEFGLQWNHDVAGHDVADRDVADVADRDVAGHHDTGHDMANPKEPSCDGQGPVVVEQGAVSNQELADGGEIAGKGIGGEEVGGESVGGEAVGGEGEGGQNPRVQEDIWEDIACLNGTNATNGEEAEGASVRGMEMGAEGNGELMGQGYLMGQGDEMLVDVGGVVGVGACASLRGMNAPITGSKECILEAAQTVASVDQGVTDVGFAGEKGGDIGMMQVQSGGMVGDYGMDAEGAMVMGVHSIDVGDAFTEKAEPLFGMPGAGVTTEVHVRQMLRAFDPLYGALAVAGNSPAESAAPGLLPALPESCTLPCVPGLQTLPSLQGLRILPGLFGSEGLPGLPGLAPFAAIQWFGLRLNCVLSKTLNARSPSFRVTAAAAPASNQHGQPSLSPQKLLLPSTPLQPPPLLLPQPALPFSTPVLHCALSQPWEPPANIVVGFCGVRRKPSKEEKMEFMAAFNITKKQVEDWFVNARARLWKPLTAKLCAETVREQRIFDVVVKEAADTYISKPAEKESPVLMTPELLAEAYERCGEVCAEYAKTFYLGTKLMTPERRRAIWAIYVWCRRTDELVDGPNASHITPRALDRWEERLDELFQGRPYDMLDAALSDTIQTFPMSIQPYRDMVDGMRMDLRKSRYRTFDELYVYCYNVAGTVGLMSVPVMGIDPKSKVPVEDVYKAALDLGIANQLTNILRDVGEDAQRGRVYLPQDELAQFGLSDDDIFEGKVTDNWRGFMKFQIERARNYFKTAEAGVVELDRQSRWPVWASLRLYAQILDAIEANDYNNFTRRAYVSKWKKMMSLPGTYIVAAKGPQ